MRLHVVSTLDDKEVEQLVKLGLIDGWPGDTINVGDRDLFRFGFGCREAGYIDRFGKFIAYSKEKWEAYFRRYSK